MGKLRDLLGAGLGKTIEGITDAATKFGVSHTGKKEFKLAVEDILAKREASFQSFVLDYEGRASDLGPWLLGFRGSVRPVLTYVLAGLWAWSHIYLFTHTDMTAEAVEMLQGQQALLFKLNLLSLGFWYGEKLLTRSGLTEMFKGK